MSGRPLRPFDRNVLLAAVLVLAVGAALPAPGPKAPGFTLAGATIGSGCIFKNLTGFDCPFCGMTRSMASLLHGRFRDAIDYHPLAPALLIFLLFQIFYRAGRLLGAPVFLGADAVPVLRRMAPFHLLLFAFLARWVVMLTIALAKLISG